MEPIRMFRLERAPVQASWKGGRAVKPAGSIAWEEHVRAHEAYRAKYGACQSAERIAERGGFGHEELLLFLGHEPETFRAA